MEPLRFYFWKVGRNRMVSACDVAGVLKSGCQLGPQPTRYDDVEIKENCHNNQGRTGQVLL